MRIAKIGTDEEARLAALAEFDLADEPSDPRLDELLALAARIFDVPIAFVALVGRSRLTYAAQFGFDLAGPDRDLSFCAHALASDDILVVPDATLDPRFSRNPFVTGDPGIRFYAGVPLRVGAGHAVGTLCIVDQAPRNGLSARDRQSLRQLARLALDTLEHRRLRVAGSLGQNRFQNIAASSPDAIICTDHRRRITFWNRAAERLFGYAADVAIGRDLVIILPQQLHGGRDDDLQRLIGGRAPPLAGRMIEREALHEDGTIVPVELWLAGWREAGRAHFGIIMRDIRERRSNEDRLFHLAHHDMLTELPNRSVFLSRTAAAIAQTPSIHLLLVELDGFRAVNATHGHRVGDLLIKEVSARLLTCARDADLVARLGDDEFAALIPGTEPEIAADCLLAALTAPFHIDGETILIGASIGIAAAHQDGTTAEALLSQADLAMFQAKREGGRRLRVFTEGLRDEALRRRAYEDELRRAIADDQFRLYYQPQVSLTDGRLIGAEALLRWQHPDRGLLAPDCFLRAVEEGQLAVELGQWVLETACAQAVSWRAAGWNFRMGVNLFEAQFRGGTLVDRVRMVLDRTGLPPQALELEITENIILQHDETMRAALGTLHADGVAIAFDDFGTGFASLSMLKAYPLSRLKIDRSFVQDIALDPTDAIIVGAVAALGSGLGLDVIAEGIETETQRDLLRISGCTSGQGYLFGRPMSADAFERWMEERGCAASAGERRA